MTENKPKIPARIARAAYGLQYFCNGWDYTHRDLLNICVESFEQAPRKLGITREDVIRIEADEKSAIQNRHDDAESAKQL